MEPSAAVSRIWEQTFHRICHPTQMKRARSALYGRGFMWLVIAALFLIAWLIAFVAFHVAMAGIHILLGLFVVCLVIHFIRKARTA
jgi:Flp pilus assembly protein TadB